MSALARQPGSLEVLGLLPQSIVTDVIGSSGFAAALFGCDGVSHCFRHCVSELMVFLPMFKN